MLQSKQQEDPLRFLKPRRKQFHLTPQKIKQNISFKQINNSSLIIKDKNEINSSKTEAFSKPTWQMTIDNKQKKYQVRQSPTIEHNKNSIYNPKKYFSQKTQLFLLSKYGNKNIQNKQVNFRNIQRSNSNRNLNKSPIQNKYRSQKNQSIQQQKQVTFAPINKVNQAKQIQNIKKQNIEEIQSDNYYGRSRQDNKMRQNYLNGGVANNTQKVKNLTKPTNLTPQIPKQQIQIQQNALQSNQLQLKQCPVCSRKFNPNSYQKHIKVCQKVFYKKRKQFSSQKQRSLSKKKQNNSKK